MPQIDDDDFNDYGLLEDGLHHITREWANNRLSPEEDQVKVLISIAISLKRIADRLDLASDTLKSAVAKARIV